MKSTQEYAEEGSRAWREKHPDAGDRFDAVEILRDFIGRGTGKGDELARDALDYVLSVWNTKFED